MRMGTCRIYAFGRECILYDASGICVLEILPHKLFTIRLCEHQYDHLQRRALIYAQKLTTLQQWHMRHF